MDTIVQTRRSLQQRLCCLCSFEAPTIAQLLSHLRLVHSSDPRFSVQCGINGCTVTCKSFPSLYSHVYRHHPDAGIRKRKTANHLMELRDFTSEPTTSSDNHELTPSLLLSDSTGIEVHIVCQVLYSLPGVEVNLLSHLLILSCNKFLYNI